MNHEASFDRDFTLGDLLNVRDADDFATALAALLGSPATVLDAQGRPYGSQPEPPGATRAPLILELEPLGFVAACAPPAALAGAARLMRWGLLSRARLRMVSDLHLEAVRADYARLQQQNEALRVSEARYRELAGELDAKVRAQIEVIDARQRQLYQAERLAAVGQLAAGVAHEINNPLGFIGSNLSAAERYRAKLAELRPLVPAAEWQARDLDFVLDDLGELLRDTRAGVDRIARIVRDLKGFSSVDQPEAQQVDLNEQLAALLAVMRGQTPPGVVVVTEFSPLPPLRCVPGTLNQAFQNVLLNALQAAAAGGGRVTVRTQAAADALHIAVVDDGPGIAPEVMPHIFDPFFTTRGVGSGTGLGLTVARDIVRAHRGTIAVDCPPGGGTCVTLIIPV